MGATAANSLLIGQIALERKLVTREQLQECLDLQAGQVNPRPLGTLLVQSGFLTEEQVATLVDEHRRRLRQDTPYAPYSKEEICFGRLLVKGGHTTMARVNEALRAQQDLADRGVRKRIGELLVEAGHLTPEAVFATLRVQGKVLMSCTFCGVHYNVLQCIADRVSCRKCGMPLEDRVADVKAEATTAYLLPAVDVSTLRRAIPAPIQAAAAAPEPASAPPPPRRGFPVSLILTILLTIVLVVLFLLSK